MNNSNKYRLVTRGDFDGVVAGALLLEKNLIHDVLFVEPRDMQGGNIVVGPGDITSNLPYQPSVFMSFDHHSSETERVGEKHNFINDPDAPSAARVIYNYYGGEKDFPEISVELMAAVDRSDTADFVEEDILAPQEWALLGFILDPRTNLAKFEHFDISHRQFLRDMMVYVRHHPIEEILKLPDVEERTLLYLDHEERFEHQLTQNTVEDGTVVITDLRKESVVCAGNRFTVYALYPEANVSVQLLSKDEGRFTEIVVGKSPLNRRNNVDIGSLLLKHGGGGHTNAGTCMVPSNKTEETLAGLISTLKN